MARRRYPKIDICKLHPERFRDMSPTQLMNVWARLGASAPAHPRVIQKIKGLVSNLAAAKSPPKDGHYYGGYKMIASRLERELWDMQAKAGCKLPESELVARDADRSEPPRPEVAARLRKKARIR